MHPDRLRTAAAMAIGVVLAAGTAAQEKTTLNTLARNEQAEGWRLLFARARRGRIGVQDHGDRVAFRNIKIRELPDRVTR